MRRVAPSSCDCGNAREAWAAACRSCWARVPVDLKERLRVAKAAKAPHLRARAEMAVTDWLRAHPVASDIARRVGEG